MISSLGRSQQRCNVCLQLTFKFSFCKLINRERNEVILLLENKKKKIYFLKKAHTHTDRQTQLKWQLFISFAKHKQIETEAGTEIVNTKRATTEILLLL